MEVADRRGRVWCCRGRDSRGAIRPAGMPWSRQTPYATDVVEVVDRRCARASRAAVLAPGRRGRSPESGRSPDVLSTEAIWTKAKEKPQMEAYSKHGNILRERKPKITPADGRGGLIDVQLPKLNCLIG